MNIKQLLKQRDELMDNAKRARSAITDDMDPADAAKAVENVKSIISEIEATDEAIAARRGVSDVTQKLKGLTINERATETDSAISRSLGEHFVKAAGDRLKNQAAGAHIEYSVPEYQVKEDAHSSPKNLVEGWGTFYQRGIINQRRERLVAADLMGSAVVTASTVKYIVEKVNRIASGAPATVAEGTKKPYVKYADFDVVTESLSKVAALAKFTDEMIEDYDFVASWINNNLVYDLSVVEEKQLIDGDGRGSNIKGLLNREGIQTHRSAKQADWFNDLFKAKNKVAQATNLEADGILINPANYEALRLAKDGNGQYIAGGPFQGQYGNGNILIDPPLWGIKTVVSNAVPEGTAIVGAFRQGATVLRKGGVRIDSANTNVDDFENNLVTLRAEERLGLMVPLPAAFVKVTLEGAAEEL